MYMYIVVVFFQNFLVNNNFFHVSFFTKAFYVGFIIFMYISSAHLYAQYTSLSLNILDSLFTRRQRLLFFSCLL